MNGYSAFQHGLWLEPALTLAVGTVVIVLPAALIGRLVTSAVWRRTIWQVATLGLFSLVLVESTGIGPATVRLFRPAVLPVSRLEVEAVEADPTVANTVANTVDNEPSSYVPVEDCTAEGYGFAHSPDVPPNTSPSFQLQWAAAVATDLAILGDIEREDERTSGRPSTSRQAEQETRQVASPPYKSHTKPRSAEDAPVLPPSGHEPSGLGWPGLLWLLGAAAVLCRIVSARALLAVFRQRHSTVADEDLHRRVAALARQLGLRRPVDLLEAHGLRAPVAFGGLRPTIALSPGFFEDFEQRQQEAVLAHELAHLAARDPAWQLLADLLCAVLWWHPLVWWLRCRLQIAGEAAADEASLLIPGGPDALAGCLVSMGKRLTRPCRLGWVSIEGGGFNSNLGRRVERLLSLPQRSWWAPRRGRLALAKTVLPVSLVIVAVLCTAWVRPQANPTKGETTMNVLTTSWRHSLAAVVLTAMLTTGGGDAVADESPAGESVPAIGGDNLPDEGIVLALLDGDEGEKREGEAHEDREHGDREEGEAREEREHERHERAERERNEREGRERAERELEQRERPRDEREEKIMALRRGFMELKEAGQRIRREIGDRGPDKAPELHAKLREIEERMAGMEREVHEAERARPRPDQPQRERAEARVHELKQKHHELTEKAQAIQRELEGLRDDQDDEARHLQAMLREVRDGAEHVEREIHGIQEAMKGRPEGPPPHEREQMMRHLEEIKREIGRLSEAGKHDEAERLKREGHEIMQRLQGRPGPPPPAPPRVPEEVERRIRHLQVAIENLHAAGLHEAAERLAQEMERRMAEFREGPRRGPGPPRPPEHREGPPQPPHPEQVIGQLRGEVEQLRREMNELRQMLKELLERER